MKIHGHDIAGQFVAALPEIPCQPECRGEEHAEYCYFPADMPKAHALHMWEAQKNGLVIVTSFERRKRAPKADDRYVTNVTGRNPTPAEAGWPAYLVRFRFADRVRRDAPLN